MGRPVYTVFQFPACRQRVRDDPGYKRLRRQARATLLRHEPLLEKRDFAGREGEGAT